MDEPDEYGFDDVTLNNASSKELLKMCAQLLQAVVSGKAQVRKEDAGRKYPSKKTLVRMGQHENMSKAEINTLQVRTKFVDLHATETPLLDIHSQTVFDAYRYDDVGGICRL